MISATATDRASPAAAIPDGIEAVVRWSEPLIETADAITGMPRVAFPAGRAVTLELLADGAPIATTTMRHVSPIALPGAVVRRGDRLAWIQQARQMRDLHAGIETLRAIASCACDCRPARMSRSASTTPCLPATR